MARKYLILFFILFNATGCSSIPKEIESKVIKVGFIGHRSLTEGAVFDDYFQWIELEYPNFHIEFVPLKDLNDLEAQPVDLILTPPQLLKGKDSFNCFYCLDRYLKTEQEFFSNYAPNVLEKLLEFGQGNLYALTPSFNPSALIYNKKILKEAGLPCPTNGMTWDQVFSLAEKISKNGIYGLYLGEGFKRHIAFDIQDFLDSTNLALYDKKTKKMNVTSPKWQKEITKLNNLLRNKAIPFIDYSDNPANEISYFCEGMSAMAIQRNPLGDLPFDWDMVAMPKHVEISRGSVRSTIDYIFGIDTRSANISDCWEIIKFIHGEKWAQINQHRVIQTYLPELRKNTFYHWSYEKSFPIITPELSEIESKIWNKFPLLINNIFLKNQSIDEQLKIWEKRGNELLQKGENNE